MKVLRRSAFATVAVAMALTLSACGGGSDDSMDASSELAGIGTIVDVAVDSGTFETLVAALTAADLVTTLSGEGPFTVFAPTDDAFANLPAGVLDGLLLPENKALLAQILTYHVLPGKVLAPEVTDGDVATVEGQTIKISTANGLTVNGAEVLIGDIDATNGVIHAIDQVLLPPGVDVSTLAK